MKRGKPTGEYVSDGKGGFVPATFKYFVSFVAYYKVNEHKHNHTFGNDVILTNNPILSRECVEKVELKLKTIDNKLTHVIILSFQII